MSKPIATVSTARPTSSFAATSALVLFAIHANVAPSAPPDHVIAGGSRRVHFCYQLMAVDQVQDVR